MPLIPQNLNLGLGQPSETEHANLCRDMVPGTRRAASLKALPETAAHLLDPTAHRAEVILPFSEERGVVQDAAGDAGTVSRRVRDLRPLQDGQLTSNVTVGGGGVGAGGRDKVEGTGALAIQAEVLGEGLGDAHLEALFHEVADGPGVAGQVARGEALVCGVEEGEVGSLAHDGGDLAPLVLAGVDAGGVVGARMQEDDGAGRRCPQRLQHAVKVQALGLLVEVGVVGDLEADIGKDLVVIGPCWARQVDGGFLRMELGEECATEVDGAGARDGLEGANLMRASQLWCDQSLGGLGIPVSRGSQSCPHRQ